MPCSLQALSPPTKGLNPGRRVNVQKTTRELPKFYSLKKNRGDLFTIIFTMLLDWPLCTPSFPILKRGAFFRSFFFLLRYSSHTIKYTQDFPVGPVTKNPPANAGEMGSDPGPGRFRVPRGSSACGLQPLNLCSRAWEPQVLKPAQPGARALQQEKPLQ